MLTLVLLLVLSTCSLPAPSNSSSCAPPNLKTFCPIFSDEFDKLDFTSWSHDITMSGGGNWEFQYYTNNRSNSYVSDGVLYLKPTLVTNF